MKKLIPSEAHIVLGVILPGRGIVMDKKKKTILVDDPVQRKQNIHEFTEQFKKDHKDLVDRLAGIESDKE